MDIFFSPRHSQYLWITFILLASVVMGVAAATKPSLIVVGIVGAIGITLLLKKFEFSILGLLIIRACLDPFSRWQLASLLALTIDVITIGYFVGCLLLHKSIKRDWWMLFMVVWILLMGMWPLATAMDWLPTGPESLSAGIREWTRIASYLAVYSLVMQLRDRVPGPKILNALLLSLVIPLSVAYCQLFAGRYLPFEVRPYGGGITTRVNGTLGHPNTFAAYLLLMMGLVWWKYKESNQKRWLALLGLMLPMYLKTNSLAGIAMLLVFLAVLSLPRLSLKSLTVGSMAILLSLGIFISTDMGRDRLETLWQTPIVNGDFNVSKAVNLSYVDGNSFSWRVAQWSYLIKAWEHSPIFGYGIGTTEMLTKFHNGAHNDFIRALAETGLVGLFLFLVLWGMLCTRILAIWWQAPPGSSQRELGLVMLAVYLAMTIGMTTEHYWETTVFYFYWLTTLAVVGWKWKVETPKPKQLPQPSNYTLPLPLELKGIQR